MERTRSRITAVMLAVTLALLAGVGTTSDTAGAAATLPSGFAETVVNSTKLFAPTLMTFAPDGRLFVAQQNGKIKIRKNGVVLDTPFLSLEVENTSDRGVLGIAFDPNFTLNHYVYVYYHRPTPTIHGVISRSWQTATSATPRDRAVRVWTSLRLTGVHTGGVMQFGPDGKLVRLGW